MKKIQDHTQSVLATLSTKSQSKPQQGETLSEVWIAALFKKFQARYGYKWTKAMESIEQTAVTEWASELSGVTGEQIKHGLVEWDGDWPPSSREFRKACLDEGKNEFGLNYTPQYHRTVPHQNRVESDELKEKRQKQYKEGIKNLRKILRVDKSE